MQRLSAIDVGTNSVRLLVADVDGGDPRAASVVALDRQMRITRLGQGVHAARQLDPDAIARTIEVLREYRARVDELGAAPPRVTATSAARDASNRDDFFDRAEVASGVRPELLPGEEEARLSFLGATAEVAAPGPYLVVDIGGGSTEIVLGATEPEGLVSLDIGCVRLTEQFLHSDPPEPEELSAAIDVVRAHIADAERAIPRARTARTCIGLAGTVSTVAAVELGLPSYERDKIHHLRLPRATVEEVFRTLATETVEQRAHNPGIDPGRVDVIVGGLVVLVTVMRSLDIDEVLVSESDILDGLVRSQVGAPA